MGKQAGSLSIIEHMSAVSSSTAGSTRPVIPRPNAGDDALIEQIRTDGFGVLRDALSPAEVAEVNREALRICRSDLSSVRLGQADAGRDGLSDDQAMRRYLCIHHPDKMSQVLRAAMSHPRIVDVLTKVIGPNVKSMQSMLFIKSEGKPGQAWHQDEYFIPTRDRSLHAAWIALDDATLDNGCLWVLPGSHAPGIIYPAGKQDDVAQFGCTVQAYDFPYTDEQAVPVEVAAGSVVVFNGYLLHRSLRNSGARGYRRALVNHYMSGESLLPWQLAEGARAAVGDYRDIVVVAGSDPYAYKGLEERRRPYVRPDGDSGCDR